MTVQPKLFKGTQEPTVSLKVIADEHQGRRQGQKDITAGDARSQALCNLVGLHPRFPIFHALSWHVLTVLDAIQQRNAFIFPLPGRTDALGTGCMHNRPATLSKLGCFRSLANLLRPS